MADQKPFPLYTDGVNLFTTFDGGATMLPVGGETATGNSSAPISGNGTVGTPFTVAAGAIALSKLATQANQTVAGNVSGGAASPVALTATQLTALLNPATASLPGAMPAAYASGLPIICMRTAIVDLTATASGIVFLQNPPSGNFAIPIGCWVEITSGAGTVSTSPTFKAGNNAGVNNLIPTVTPSTANMQGTITNTPPTMAILSTPGGSTSATLVDTATPHTVTITGATGTGGFALSGRVTAFVALLSPIP